jgi:hypothetical protein
MTNTSENRPATRAEMDQLFVDHGFEQYLSSQCDRNLSYETEDVMHRVFCCTTRLYRYVDRTTNEEVASTAEITKAGSSTPYKRIITSLFIGGILYYHLFRPHH